jgi:hypothetical protein
MKIEQTISTQEIPSQYLADQDMRNYRVNLQELLNSKFVPERR